MGRSSASGGAFTVSRHPGRGWIFPPCEMRTWPRRWDEMARRATCRIRKQDGQTDGRTPVRSGRAGVLRPPRHGRRPPGRPGHPAGHRVQPGHPGRDPARGPAPGPALRLAGRILPLNTLTRSACSVQGPFNYSQQSWPGGVDSGAGTGGVMRRAADLTGREGRALRDGPGGNARSEPRCAPGRQATMRWQISQRVTGSWVTVTGHGGKMSC